MMIFDNVETSLPVDRCMVEVALSITIVMKILVEPNSFLTVIFLYYMTMLF